jgi:hypothetical protein
VQSMFITLMRQAAWPGVLAHISSLNKGFCGVRLYIHVPFMRLRVLGRHNT